MKFVPSVADLFHWPEIFLAVIELWAALSLR